MKLAAFLARGLDAGEREVVLGDIAESGAGAWDGIRDVLGLVVRRQAALWTGWRPWLALLGIGVAAGLPLSRIGMSLNVDLSLQLRTLRQYAVHYETGLSAGEDALFLLCKAAALVTWSWTCGFVLGRLSGRAAWLTWCVLYFVPYMPHPFSRILFGLPPFGISALLFLMAMLRGTLEGVRQTERGWKRGQFAAIAAIILAVVLFWSGSLYESAHRAWSDGSWQGPAWPVRLAPYLLICWPAAYILAISQRKEGEIV